MGGPPGIEVTGIGLAGPYSGIGGSVVSGPREANQADG